MEQGGKHSEIHSFTMGLRLNYGFIRMSQNRKARVRSRLREVDSVIEAVRASGVQLKALVRINPNGVLAKLTRPTGQGLGITDRSTDASSRQVHSLQQVQQKQPQISA